MKKIRAGLFLLFALLATTSCSYRGISSTTGDSSSSGAGEENSSTTYDPDADTNTYGYGISDNEKIYISQIVSDCSIARTLDFEPDTENEVLNARFEASDSEGNLEYYIYRGHNEWGETTGSFSMIMSFELYVAVSIDDLTISDYTYDGTIASSESTLNNFLDDGLNLIGTDGDVDLISGSTHSSENIIEIATAAVRQAHLDTDGDD